MTGLNHAVTGALVAAAIDKPLIALPAALLSHFVCDGLPHWNYRLSGSQFRKNLIRLTDFLLSLWLLICLALVVRATAWLVITGGLLAILPDMMWLRFFLTGRPSVSGNKRRLINRVRRFHLFIQWSETDRGIYFEAVWFIVMLVLILTIHR